MNKPFNDKNCLEFSDRRKRVVLEERSRKYIGLNNKEKLFSAFRVDDCLVSERPRCDYLLLSHDEKISYFIELKGSDLLKAAEQIDSSIEVLLKQIDFSKVEARIVLTKVNTPDIRHSRYIKLERKIKALGGRIIKSVNILEEKL